ncbi:WD domain, G-beta repeat-containing protein [Cardiosporidium cionae]|uniref:WD domain, G-beta repeat-containing protein n=1 Tax=Cardiosporidium cionae TaxID=476202 RepID=A0ABQ7JBW1_9APIC|nr:WD domain, G-beta repeat-containing protein [Cardiosporidium cionae]|eukprot:KAF8821384.1 WD domain, G-beta repeat-containing protein [Cardiosporidium cionae]
MDEYSKFWLAALVWPDWETEHSISCLSSNVDSSFIAAGTRQGYIILWEREQCNLKQADDIFSSPSPLAVYDDSSMELPHVENNSKRARLHPRFFLFSHWNGAPPVVECTFAIAPSPKLQSSTNEILISLHGDNSLRYWSLQDGRCLSVLVRRVHFRILNIRCLPYRRFLVLAGEHNAQVFDVWTELIVCNLSYEAVSRADFLKSRGVFPPDGKEAFYSTRSSNFESKICSIACVPSSDNSKLKINSSQPSTVAFPLKPLSSDVHSIIEGRDQPEGRTVGPRILKKIPTEMEEDAKRIIGEKTVKLAEIRDPLSNGNLGRLRPVLSKSNIEDAVNSFQCTNLLVACLLQNGVVACWDLTEIIAEWTAMKKVHGAMVLFEPQKNSKQDVNSQNSQETKVDDSSVSGKMLHYGTHLIVKPIFVTDTSLVDSAIEVGSGGKSSQLAISSHFLFLIADSRLLVWKRILRDDFEPLVDLFCPDTAIPNKTDGIRGDEGISILSCWIGLHLVDWTDNLHLSVPDENRESPLVVLGGNPSRDSTYRRDLNFEPKDSRSATQIENISSLSQIIPEVLCSLIVWTSGGLVAVYDFSNAQAPSTKARFLSHRIPKNCLGDEMNAAPIVITNIIKPQAAKPIYPDDYNLRNGQSGKDAIVTSTAPLGIIDIEFFCIETTKEDKIKIIEVSLREASCQWYAESIMDVWKVSDLTKSNVDNALTSEAEEDSKQNSGHTISNIFFPWNKAEGRKNVVWILAESSSKLFLIGSFDDGTLIACCLNVVCKDNSSNSSPGNQHRDLYSDDLSIPSKLTCNSSRRMTLATLEVEAAYPEGLAYPLIKNLPLPSILTATNSHISSPLAGLNLKYSWMYKKVAVYNTLCVLSRDILVGGNSWGDVTLWNMPYFNLVAHFPCCHISPVVKLFNVVNLKDDSDGMYCTNLSPDFFVSIDASNHIIFFDVPAILNTSIGDPLHEVYMNAAWDASVERYSPCTREDTKLSLSASYYNVSGIHRLEFLFDCNAEDICGVYLNTAADIINIMDGESVMLWTIKTGSYLCRYAGNDNVGEEAYHDAVDPAYTRSLLQHFYQSVDFKSDFRKTEFGYVLANLRVNACGRSNRVSGSLKCSSQNLNWISNGNSVETPSQNEDYFSDLLGKSEDPRIDGSIAVILLPLESLFGDSNACDEISKQQNEDYLGNFAASRCLANLPLGNLFYPFHLTKTLDDLAENFFPFLRSFHFPLTIAIVGAGLALSIPIPQANSVTKSSRNYNLSLATPSSEGKNDTAYFTEAKCATIPFPLGNNSYFTSRLTKFAQRGRNIHKKKNYFSSIRRFRASSVPLPLRYPFSEERNISIEKGYHLTFLKHLDNISLLRQFTLHHPVARTVPSSILQMDLASSINLNAFGRQTTRSVWLVPSSFQGKSSSVEVQGGDHNRSKDKTGIKMVPNNEIDKEKNIPSNNFPDRPLPKLRVVDYGSKVDTQWHLGFFSSGKSPFYAHPMGFASSPYTFALMAVTNDAFLSTVWLGPRSPAQSLRLKSADIRDAFLTEVMAAARYDGLCLSLLGHMMLFSSSSVIRESSEFVMRRFMRYSCEQKLREYVKSCFTVLRGIRVRRGARRSDNQIDGICDTSNVSCNFHSSLMEDSSPTLLKNQGSNELKAVEVSLLILSALVYERPALIKKFGPNVSSLILQYLLLYHLRHKNSGRKGFLFCELLADGCEVLWKPFVFRTKYIVKMFETALAFPDHAVLSSYISKDSTQNKELLWCIFEVFDNYQFVYLSKPCTRILESISLEETGLVIQAMGWAARRPDKEQNYNTAALFFLLRLTQRFPTKMFHFLTDITDVVTKCLDPTDISQRRKSLPAVTSFLFHLVKNFPMVAFHANSQRLAVGGPSTIIVLYDLRTATMWRILEGHTGAVSGLGFSDGGNLLGSYSAEDCSFRVWQTAPIGFFGGMLGLSATFEKSVSLKAIPSSVYDNSVYHQLKNIQVEYKDPSKWFLRR